uniref:Uncharacterized protein n=1 Tax=Anguilla anguilla TaxID=7936 RepID=A0A0E9PZS6_ANGAN
MAKHLTSGSHGFGLLLFFFLLNSPHIKNCSKLYSCV